MALEELIATTEAKFKKAIDALRHDVASVRTGRAAPSLVETLEVEAYGGVPTPLIQLAAISAPEPRQIVITPWDKSLIKAIEKAIASSDLGLAPNSDGNLIRLNIPSLNEERRRDLVKQLQDALSTIGGELSQTPNLLPAHYTGFVVKDNGYYTPIRDAGLATGKLAPK